MAKLGLDGVLYYGAASSTASTEMTNCSDVSINLSLDAVDATNRASDGWKSYIAGLLDAELSWEMQADGGTDFTAIQGYFIAKTPIALLATDGATGLDLDVILTKFEVSQDDEDVMSVSVSAVPYCGTRKPTWGSGGASSSSGE